MTFTVFDILALILVGWLTMRGLMRGAIAQVASVASVVISWIIAVKFSPVVAPLVSQEPPWDKVFAMFVLFVASTIAIWLIRGLVNDIIKAIHLKTADRSLGAVLGFVKGILLCSIITFFLVVFSDATRSFVLGSVSGKYFAAGIERASLLVPEDVNEALSKKLAAFRQSIEGELPSELGQGIMKRLADELPGEQEEKNQPFFGELKNNVKDAINNVKDELSSVFSLSDIDKQTPLPQSPLREKVGDSSAVVPTPAEPSAPYSEQTQPRRTVLPFQPSR